MFFSYCMFHLSYSYARPFQKSAGRISIQLLSSNLKYVSLVNVLSSSPDFTIKNMSNIVPTPESTKPDSFDLYWEAIHPFAEETMVVLYFQGTLNQMTVVYPYKVLMTVSLC
jgi:hypothetical protein